MHLTENDTELRDALSRFETRLNTPLISGELDDWATTLDESWQAVRNCVLCQRETAHRGQLKEIGKQDPELLPQVAHLKDEDEQIARQVHELDSRIQRLANKAPQIEPNEGRASDELDQLLKEGIAFVQRVRKQEVGIETWFSEAFNRDRGVGD